MATAVTRRVAYVTSAFPHLTETFILREVCGLERSGWDVAMFALKRSPRPGTHADALRWAPRVRLPSLVGREVLGANLHYLARAPLRLLGLWAQALWWHRGSLNFLLRVPVTLLRGAALARALEAAGIEHVHAHFATHPALAALAAARLAGTGFSVTAHAHDLYIRQAGLAPKLRRARFVACISEFNRRFLLERYPELDPARLVIVRCGVDPRTFRPAEARPAGRDPLVLCVASLQEYKGQRVLLDAFARLLGRLPAARCVLVGEGPLRAALEAQAAGLGIAARVDFLGAQPQERVAELVRAADVFVAPSIVARDGQMDGIPVALMEALAAGLPTVASDLSGIAELVIHERTGLLVPPEDPAALAAALERVLTDRDLAARLAAEGRAHVLREFDLDANVARLAALFEQALAERADAAGAAPAPAAGDAAAEPPPWRAAAGPAGAPDAAGGRPA